jgi:hypothetical protein
MALRALARAGRAGAPRRPLFKLTVAKKNQILVVARYAVIQ